MTTKLAVVKNETRPLTSAEARMGIERCEEAARAALAAGDEAAWMQEQSRRAFHVAALELAEKREAEEAEEERRRQREALRPEAEKAIHAATLSHAIADETKRVEAAVEELIACARSIFAKLPAIRAAQEPAVRLSRKSGVPFVPVEIGEESVKRIMRDHIQAVIGAARLPQNVALLVPPVNIAWSAGAPVASDSVVILARGR